MEKITVLADLGNSETRCYVIYKGKTWYKAMSNCYVNLETPVPNEYNNEQTFTFVYDGSTYAQGKYVLREFNMRAMRPNSMTGKSEQLTTFLALNLIFIMAVRLVASTNNCKVKDLDEIEFCVGVLLPPAEHSKSADALKAAIEKIDVIRCVTPVAFTKNITITSTIVVPEGAAAFIAALYELKDGTIRTRAGNECYESGDVLVIDIGAGTTDIVQIKDSDLVLSSKDTMRKGGRNIESICKKALESRFEYTPTDADIREVFSTGYLPQGVEKHDVVNILDDAKRQFSSILYNYLISYLERNEMEVRAVKGLLVVGGGALATKRGGEIVSPKIAESLISYIQQLSSTIKLVDTGNVDPRRMNIEGLRLYYVFASIQGGK